VELTLSISAVALFVGVVVGITGVGAGALMTPLLISVFGFPIPVAIATDLLFATVTKLVGVGLHHRVGNINWSVARQLWLGSIPGVALGVVALVLLSESAKTQWLVWPLALLVLATAITLAKRALVRKEESTQTAVVAIEAKGKPLGLLGTAGAFGIGLAVALTSVGAGALGMALLVRLYPPDTAPQELVGTDLVHAVPIALIAGVAYGSAGLVSWPLLAALLIGSLPGVAIGALLADRFPSRVINGFLAFVLSLAAVLVVV
jgi:uncharacterized membrane protein YfcA